MVLPRARGGGRGDELQQNGGGLTAARSPQKLRVRVVSVCLNTGACAGGAAATAAVPGAGQAAGAARVGAHGQDGAADGVRQPEVPLRANCLCPVLARTVSVFRPARGWSQRGHAGAREEGASKLAEAAFVLMEMLAWQEEQEQARAQQKNDYEGSLRGGLPHGFGTKIYAVEKRWQGTGVFTANWLSSALGACSHVCVQHRCAQGGARVHAPRPSCMCPHAFRHTLLPCATQGAFGHLGLFFKRASLLGRLLLRGLCARRK